MDLINEIDNSIFEQEIYIHISKADLDHFNIFACVFKSVDEYGNIFWHKNGERDIEIPISVKVIGINGGWKGLWESFVNDIITAEIDWESITLMHRYNLLNEIINKWFENLINSGSYKKILDISELQWCASSTNSKYEKFEDESKVIDEATKYLIYSGEEFWAWIMIWMRFNSLGILDWQRNYNTAPRLLAHSAEMASLNVVSRWVEMPKYRYQIRLIIQTIIRGGSRGQEVRDKILHIMHKNHIPETHGTFYEQWHQKLHNNTTPDDVGICRSIIGYLKSNGNEETFTKLLKEEGLSWEKIGSYERPITSKPFLPPGLDSVTLAHDFEEYLEILIDVHEALNLQRSFHYSKHYLDCGLQSLCSSIIYGEGKKFDDTNDINVLHSRVKSINEAREGILNMIYYTHGGKSPSGDFNKHAIKEIMFLDLGLEGLQNMFIQKMCTIKNNYENPNYLIDEMVSFLWISFGHDPCNGELEAIYTDWKRFREIEICSENYLLVLKSLLERLHIFIGVLIEKTYSNWDPKVIFFAENIGLNRDNPIIISFLDEILRSTLFSTISLQIKRLNSYLSANLSSSEFQDWQFISYNPSWRADQTFSGIFKNVNKITDINEDEFPKIVVCSYISGEEDIPVNVNAIILTNPEFSPDILSHLSVRARNMQTLLVTSNNFDIFSNCVGSLKEDEIIDVRVTNDMRLQMSKSAVSDINKLSETETTNKVKVKKKSKFFELKNKLNETNRKLVIFPEEMTPNNVGQKALNLIRLRSIFSNGKVPFFVPYCISLPFGTLNKLMSSITGEQINSKLKKLEQENLGKQEISDILNNICKLIDKEVESCNQLFEEVYSSMKLLKLVDYGSSESLKTEIKFQRNSELISLISGKIKKVWSSIYQPMAYLNMKKIGQPLSNVFMSVVIQRLIGAEYAFVLHSKNPIQSKYTDSDEYDEMYGEIVIGLGETLVSNTCGKALGFTAARKKNSRNYWDRGFIERFRLVSFPSKSIAMFDSSPIENINIASDDFSCNFIFRSDSNAEDIEGFAGAGVFQSVPLFEPIKKYVKYLNRPIIIDKNYRDRLINLLAIAAFYIQDEFNNIPQDIEGCVIENKHSRVSPFNIAIVQSRPQI
ncbi:putative alpha-glucan water dikinase 1 [Cryptosporidium felis]|nr:putative alpha-glucan water dikinase 1 [Cryptosporidium felis]